MAGLLDYISGSKLAGALRQYVSDALPGGSLNPEAQPVADRAKYAAGLLDPNSQISRDTQQWHKKTQAGLVDLLKGQNTPAADYGYQQVMNMAGNAPLGITVWHGSPHKFSQFDMSKIGTGEGAQAYGHGLYMAESPEVAGAYQKNLSGTKFVEKSSGSVYDTRDIPIDKMSRLQTDFEPYQGALYKVDVPDEAVARFLDWDKPLSQQAPEVQRVLERRNPDMYSPNADDYDAMEMGQSIYRRMFEDSIRSGKALPAKVKEEMLTAELNKLGIPGIRYLDQGSRTGGQGTSNFVLFDDRLPRILETNGVPTGLQPWKPGEWK